MLRRQHLPVFACVIALHALALWAMQSGLLQRAMNELETAVVLADVLLPAPAPLSPSQVPDKPAAAAKPAPAPNPAPRAEPKAASQEPAVPSASAGPLPSLAPTPANTSASQNAPVASTASQATNPTANQVPAPSVSAKIELPSSDAQYLQNPKPGYPALSRRLNEQGKVVVRVLIGADGQAQKAEIGQSSGYERLDQAALRTVLSWRYVPGKRAGVPEAMWFNVPINFVLE